MGLWISGICQAQEFNDLTGIPVLGANPLLNLSLPMVERAETSIVPVIGQSFDKALRVKTLVVPDHSYQIQVRVPTNVPVEVGDVMLMTFYVRGISSTFDDGRVWTEFIFEERTEPHRKSASYRATAVADGSWTRVDVPFVNAYRLGAGEAHVAFRFGFGLQTVEIGGIELTNYGSSVAVENLPASAHPGYEGREPDAIWRMEAKARIEQIRMADLEIEVVDGSGNPIRGAEVEVRMTRHAFPFGSAVNARFLNDPLQRRYREEVERLFNTVVIENALKWHEWEGLGGDYHGPKAISWLRNRNILVRGHHLLMPNYRSVPADVANMLNNTPPDLEGAQRRIVDHIEEKVSELRGNVIAWDVLNEPGNGSDQFFDILGDRRDQYMADWFSVARSADPDAELFLNQAVILTKRLSESDSMREPTKDLIARLIELGAPFDAIGMQGHFVSVLTPPEELLTILDDFSRFGKPIWVTEFDVDIRDQAVQADFTRDFYIAMFSHPNVEGIMMWGFWDGRHWKNNAPIFNRDWSLKPSGQAWIDLIFNEWWTEEEGRTNCRGMFRTRGFLGDYEIEVRVGETTVVQTFALTKESAPVRVVVDPR